MHAQTHWIATQDGQKLYAKTWGDQHKPAMVLVHGYPDNQEVWESIIAQLLTDFYIITYDVRGAGQSTIPKRIRDYTLARLSLDLACVVNNLLPERSFHLVAHDWGSIQSWESVTEPKFKDRIQSYTTISGPCLDHAAFWMQHQFKQHTPQFFKQLTKSWYIAAFQLPWLAPTVWHFMRPEYWGKIVSQLENKSNLPLNSNIAKDGQYGIALYRANFIPRLIKPRQRFAICPVQAIVLKRDQFVSPALIDEIPKWASDFEQIEVDANHWAILSQPQKIAEYIQEFAHKKSV